MVRPLYLAKLSQIRLAVLRADDFPDRAQVFPPVSGIHHNYLLALWIVGERSLLGGNSHAEGLIALWLIYPAQTQSG